MSSIINRFEISSLNFLYLSSALDRDFQLSQLLLNRVLIARTDFSGLLGINIVDEILFFCSNSSLHFKKKKHDSRSFLLRLCISNKLITKALS